MKPPSQILLLYLAGIWSLSQATLCKSPGCACIGTTVKCHCYNHNQEVIIDTLSTLTSRIEIVSCTKVTMKGGCLEPLKALRTVIISKVSQVVLQENAFKWGKSANIDSDTGINISIEESSVALIPSYTFQGQISSIQFVSTTVNEIQVYAFSNLAMTERIEFKDCGINRVARQAFKKFYVDSFVIEGGHVEELPSFVMKDVAIGKEMRLEGVRLGTVNSQAFVLLNPQSFKLQECTARVIEGDAFRVSAHGPVMINHNYFEKLGRGAFAGIYLDSRFQSQSGKQDWVMENNTLITFDEGALLLNATGFRITIDRIVINLECACPQINSWINKLVRYVPDSPVSGMERIIWCQKNKRSIVLEEYQLKACSSVKGNVFIIVVGVLMGLIVLGIGCSAGYCLFKKHAKKYQSVPNRNSQASSHVLVVPEGKTYRETELHVIVEKAEPIVEFKGPTHEGQTDC